MTIAVDWDIKNQTKPNQTKKTCRRTHQYTKDSFDSFCSFTRYHATSDTEDFASVTFPIPEIALRCSTLATGLPYNGKYTVKPV